MPSLQNWKSVAYISMRSVVEQDLLHVPMYDCKTSPVFLSMPIQACGRLWYVLHLIYIPSSVLTKKKQSLPDLSKNKQDRKGSVLTVSRTNRERRLQRFCVLVESTPDPFLRDINPRPGRGHEQDQALR